MNTKKYQSLILKTLFIVSYTLVILPFTVVFFQTIVQAPAVESYFSGAIDLQEWHRYALPVFLMCLEFVSVSLAIAFWRLDKKAALALLLFLFCQVFAMTATFHGVRAKQLDQIHATEAKNYELLLDTYNKDHATWAISKASYDTRVRDAGAEVVGLEETRIRQQASVDAANDDVERCRVQVALGSCSQTELARRRTIAAVSLAALTSTQVQKGDAFDRKEQIPEFAEPEPRSPAPPIRDPNNDTINFIVTDIWSAHSLFTMLVTLLFPVTILGMGYVLSGSSNDVGTFEVKSPAVSIAKELEIAARLPAEAHRGYASSLKSVVAAYLASIRSVKELAITISNFHLETERDFAVAKAAEQLASEVGASEIAPAAKSILIDAIREQPTTATREKPDNHKQE